jgi:hypothetical protein
MQCWIVTIQITDAEPATRPFWKTYTYESDGRSKKQIAANDLVFLRDQKRLLAVARVEHTSAMKLEHSVLKCPHCGIAEVEMRKKSNVRYRCFYGHQFAAPVETPHLKTKHTVYFARNLARVAAPIESAELRPFELTNGRHAKLNLAHINGICAYVARRDHTVAPKLKAWLRTGSVGLGDHDAADRLAPHPLPLFDEQEQPDQTIRLRRGHASFRDKLIDRYGARCMISGCSVLALLEACHVNRYGRPGDNHPANGVLLRSDLHTLFDLDLIGLEPVTMKVTVHSTLIGTEYEKFSGARLLMSGEKRIDTRAVRSRWDQFRRKSSAAMPRVPLAAE